MITILEWNTSQKGLILIFPEVGQIIRFDVVTFTLFDSGSRCSWTSVKAGQVNDKMFVVKLTKSKLDYSYLDCSMTTLDHCQTQQQETPASKRQLHLSKVQFTVHCWCSPRFNRLLSFWGFDKNPKGTVVGWGPVWKTLIRCQREMRSGAWSCALGGFSLCALHTTTKVSSCSKNPSHRDGPKHCKAFLYTCLRCWGGKSSTMQSPTIWIWQNTRQSHIRFY